MDSDLREFLVNHSLEGIVVTDLEGNILEVNDTTEKMLGYRSSELTDQFVGTIFPPQSVSHLLPNLLHLALAGGGFEGDIILHDSFGDNVMVRMHARGWPGTNPARLLLRFLDWRETQHLMAQLRESSQMAGLGTLARSLSHEILNPVAVIGGHTRRLLGSLEPGSGEEEWTRQVMSAVEKLEDMIRTIDTFLSLPAPSFEKGSLNDVVTRSLDVVRDSAREKGIRITRDKGGKLPPIFMDMDLMEQAMTAVLLNSVDRMPGGGDLILDHSCQGGFCQVRVQDSGPALDALQMEEDLSPVHVLGSHPTHLNLAIARRIIDEHGGKFEIGTSSARGLKVRITLPTDRRALAREREM